MTAGGAFAPLRIKPSDLTPPSGFAAGRVELLEIYRRLRAARGPLHWWPARTPFEVALGAILTQNTAWSNVERALDNLRRARSLSFRGLLRLKRARLEQLLRPSGYFRQKAARVERFLHLIRDEYGGSPARLFAQPLEVLRPRLLAVNGIGPETADSICLYAAGHKVFVVDTYTRRLVLRHGLMDGKLTYDALQVFFQQRLPLDAELYNDFHAQIVILGKDHCRARARCEGCPLEALPHDYR